MFGEMLTILKKELIRVFSDKRMVMTIIMPGIILYVVYSLIGTGMADKIKGEGSESWIVSVVNMPEHLEAVLQQPGAKLQEVAESDIAEKKQAVADEGEVLLMVFPEELDEILSDASYLQNMDGVKPQIEMFYNSANTQSYQAYSTFSSICDAYESQLVNVFDINSDMEESYDLATEEDGMMQMFSMLLPMLLIIFLFSGCMSVAAESIAGEKERGTLAKLLVTPINRWSLSLGKIIGIGIVGLVGAVSSFLGVMLSLPKMMNSMSEAEDGTSVNMNMAIYGAKEYIYLFLIICTTVLVIVGAISIISGLARNVKEAGTMATPLMLLTTLLGVSTVAQDGAQATLAYYAIPFYNSVQGMAQIFSGEVRTECVLLTVVMNLVYTVVLAVVLAKIFDSEKIIYN